MSSKVLPIRFTGRLVVELDSLVEEGLYSSKAEAVREAVRILLRLQKGSIKSKKSALQLSREAKKAVWMEALKKAKGNEEKALRELKKMASKNFSIK